MGRVPPAPGPKAGNKVGQRDDTTTMQLPILTVKTQGIYFACSPERDVICYGNCWDEAVNNLQDELNVLRAERKEPAHAQ